MPKQIVFPCVNQAELIEVSPKIPAANEVVVKAFLHDKIGFLQMSDAIEWAMQTLPFIPTPTYQDYVETDALVRRMVEEKIQ